VYVACSFAEEARGFKGGCALAAPCPQAPPRAPSTNVTCVTCSGPPFSSEYGASASSTWRAAVFWCVGGVVRVLQKGSSCRGLITPTHPKQLRNIKSAHRGPPWARGRAGCSAGSAPRLYWLVGVGVGCSVSIAFDGVDVALRRAAVPRPSTRGRASISLASPYDAPMSLPSTPKNRSSSSVHFLMSSAAILKGCFAGRCGDLE
jgi:hypothetical protein